MKCTVNTYDQTFLLQSQNLHFIHSTPVSFVQFKMANPSAGTREFLPLPSIARATIDCLLELESLNRTERARIATWAEEVLVFGSPNECLQVQLESNPPAVQKVCAILHDILIAAQDRKLTTRTIIQVPHRLFESVNQPWY